MNELNIKDSWNNIDEYSGIPGYGITSLDKYIKGQTLSVFGKIRWLFIRDFIVKSVGGVFILLNLNFYWNDPTVMLINLIILGMLLLMLIVGISVYKKFNRLADPGKDAKQNLTSLLTFLKRHFNVPVILYASTQVFVFIPGLLSYFFLVYGEVKYLTPLSYFVFSFLCLIGIVVSIILTLSQVKYHERHIRICLSDLNDNALAQASENIKLRRKQDTLIIILTAVGIFLGFVLVLAIVHSMIA